MYRYEMEAETPSNRTFAAEVLAFDVQEARRLAAYSCALRPSMGKHFKVIRKTKVA